MGKIRWEGGERKRRGQDERWEMETGREKRTDKEIHG